MEGLDLVGMPRLAPVVPLSPDGFTVVLGDISKLIPGCTFSRILRPTHFFRLQVSDHHILQRDHCTCSLILSVMCVCVCVCVCACALGRLACLRAAGNWT